MNKESFDDLLSAASIMVMFVILMIGCYFFGEYSMQQANIEADRQASIAKCDKQSHGKFYVDSVGQIWCDAKQ